MHWIMQGQSVQFWKRMTSSQNNKQTESSWAVNHDRSHMTQDLTGVTCISQSDWNIKTLRRAPYVLPLNIYNL